MNKTVVISCAGMGTRLNMNTPKCLVQVGGMSLIERLLHQLEDVDDIRVVVGYKKEDVIDHVSKINDKVKFYVSDNYMNTGTADSLCRALDGTEHDLVLAIDGDLLINPQDMEELLNTDGQFICGTPINTENPVLVTVRENEVVKFSREEGDYEWAGVAQFKKSLGVKGTNHVYQLLEQFLPMSFIIIREKEIDTPTDLEKAQQWIVENDFDKKSIIDGWFKSRFGIESKYETSRHSINNRIDYDMDFIKQYVDSASTVLDLGCGTGIIEEQLCNFVAYIKAIDKYNEFLERATNASNVQYEKHDVINYCDDEQYDVIMMFGVSIYLLEKELEMVINNCRKMMKDDSVLIIKNQWSISEEDKVINKQYSASNTNWYYCIYRSLNHIKELLEQYGYLVEYYNIYPDELNNYSDTHEYAVICRKKFAGNKDKSTNK